MPSTKVIRLLTLPTLALGASPRVALPAQDSGDREAPSLQAAALLDGAEVQLDGLLDEPIWRAADPATGFRQREPDEGVSATERTEVRVLYDRNNLYIGVYAFDSDPQLIIARQLERDASLGLSRFGPGGGDDSIELIFDTFHDRRNAYYFATNPAGALVDGLITDESETIDLNWNAVWDVRARRTADGWSAEFVIPFRTLRFKADADLQVWGFNVQRIIKRKNEQVLWTSWSRDNEGLHRISLAGELGLGSLEKKLSLGVKPYVLAEGEREFITDLNGNSAVDGGIGLDAKVSLASGMVLDLTVNTDFAQVEADVQQIDLTRFRLFFPEKRDFFLENAGIFEFGTPSFFGPPAFLLFFSRRIGLEETDLGDTEVVPMIAGARLTGRSGRQTIGVLDVVTGQQESLGVPLTNFAVGRIKRDIGQRSYVGVMLTHRAERDRTNNIAGGVDWSFWLSNPLEFKGYYAATQQGNQSVQHSWRLDLGYTGDWWGWVAEHIEIGPNFNPGVGFVLRHNIARSHGLFRLSPRPPIPGLRKIDIFTQFEYITAQDSRDLRDRRFELTFRPQMDSGDNGRFEVQRQFQRLDEPFELTPGVIVPEGDYSDWVFTGSLRSSRNRLISGGIRGRVQDFWGGDRWVIGGDLSFRSRHISVGVSYDHNDIDVPDGAFTTDLLGIRLDAAVNTRLFGNALIQYNSQAEAFDVNLRIDFIHHPDSDLFIVFNDRRTVGGGRWDPESRALIVKLTYLYWF